MFEVDYNFANHGRIFNAFFALFASLLASVVVFLIALNIGFIRKDNLVVVVVVLSVIPSLIFAANWFNYGLRLAWYRLANDRIMGVFDRHKILENFEHTYKLNSLKVKPEKVKADGRWNFHAETAYMQRLQHERDAWLSQLTQECENKLSDNNQRVIQARDRLACARRELARVKEIEESISQALNDAKSAAETYAQRRKFEPARRERMICEQEVINLEHELQRRAEQKDNIIDNYLEAAKRMEHIYENRHRKYTELAIKTINKVNNLHYEIKDLPQTSTIVTARQWRAKTL